MISFKVQVSSLRSGCLILSLCLMGLGCSVDSRKAGGPTLGNQSDFDKDPGTNFRVDALKVNSTVAAKFNAYGLPTAKTFNFQACIKDQNGAQVLPDQVFEIADESNAKVTCSKTKYNSSGVCKTDFLGCLNWSETHEFSYLNDETYFKFRRQFTPGAIYIGRAYVEVALNPWADGAASVVDLRFNALPGNAPIKDVGVVSVSGQKIAVTSKPNLVVNLKSASFEFLGLDYANYEINSSLDLKVAHKYTVRLSPSIIRKTIAKTVVPEVLNTGRMKAIVVVVKEAPNLNAQFNPENVITSFEFIGDLSYGELVAEAVVKFDNVADITSRTQVLVTLVPMDELAGMGEVSFYGAFKPGVLAPVALKPVTKNESARELRAQYLKNEAEQPDSKMTPYQMFVANKESGFLPLDLQARELLYQPFFGRNSEINVKSALDTYLKKQLSVADQGRLAMAMCSRVYDSGLSTDTKSQRLMKWMQMECERRPLSYIHLATRDFVEKLNSRVPKKVGITTLEKFSMSVSRSKVESEVNSVGKSTGSRFGLSLGLGGDLGFGIGGSAGGSNIVKSDPTSSGMPYTLDINPIKAGFSVSAGAKVSWGKEWYRTNVISETATNSTAVTASTSFDVTAEGNSFELDLLARPCIFVGASASALATFAKQGIKTLPGRYYCSAKLESKKNTETYYLIGQNVGNTGSPYNDTASSSEVRWRGFIRGERMMSIFAAIVADKGLKLVLEKIPEEAIQAKYKSFYVDQEEVGMLSH